MIYFPLFYIYTKLYLLVFKNISWVPMIVMILRKVHKLFDKIEVSTSSGSFENLTSHPDLKKNYHSFWLIVGLLINNKPIYLLLGKIVK